MQEWISGLFADPELLRMGHRQRRADANLGMGWIYYGLARLIRPRRVVVIGSYRGFVPLVLGRALQDNGEAGEVVFVDPSMVDDFWTEPEAVDAHFAGHGVTNVRHHLATTQAFVETEAYGALDHVGIVFIDGWHTAEQARFDHEAFRDRLTPDGVTLFHDSLRGGRVSVYGPERAYERTVKDYVDELRRDDRLQVLDLDFKNGLSLVRRA